MKLLKIVVFFFIVYFIRRFFQMYKVMKDIQARQMYQDKNNPPSKKCQEASIDAEFRTVD